MPVLPLGGVAALRLDPVCARRSPAVAAWVSPVVLCVLITGCAVAPPSSSADRPMSDAPMAASPSRSEDARAPDGRARSMPVALPQATVSRPTSMASAGQALFEREPTPARRAAPARTAAAYPSSAPSAPAASPSTAGAGGGESTTLNFVNTDIQTVVRGLARFTGRNFLLDPRVKGEITLVTENPVPADIAYRMLLGALRMQGITIVEVGGVSRVVPEADAKSQGGDVVSGAGAGSRAEGVVTRTFRLSYENAANLATTLRPMIAPNNPIAAYPGNNTLVITDYAENLERIARIIATIDTPAALATDVVPLHNGIAVDIAAMAAELLDTQGSDATQRVAIVADPRGNSVVIRASSPERVRLARDLILKLDDTHTDPGNMHVVYLRNAQASHLAEVLRGLVTREFGTSGQGGDDGVRAALGSGGMLSGTGSGPSSDGSASGAGSAASASSGANSRQSGSQFGRSGARGAGGAGGVGGQETQGLGMGSSSGFSSGDTSVQADSVTNTLIISAPEPMYRSLRKVIDMLDQRRAQVLVESLIVEVTQNDAAELGIQWMLGNAGRAFGGASFPGSSLNANGLTSIDVLPPGLSIGIIDGALNLPGIGEVTNLKLLARALQTKGGANILSTPNLMTLDNEPASIMVGKTIPFVSGQYVTSGSGGSDNPFQTIQREDIGLKLNIRPQISEGGTVKLDIYQEVSSVDAALSGDAGVVTNKRAIDTSVLLDDGQIMVLGGLLEDSVTNGTDAVPVLGSIPILGALFRYDTRQRVKTNLMVFLRPHVVRNSNASASLTQDRYNYMRRAQAAVQPAKHYALPDMGASILPPLGVPTVGQTPAYDLRPESWEDTQGQTPPPTQSSSALRERPSAPSEEEKRQVVHTRLPAGLTIGSDPAALHGNNDSSVTVLQIADAQSQETAETIAQRVRISGVRAYTMVGPGGMGYVVRADVSRDPSAVDTAVQVLRELGYRPELSVGP